MLLNNMEKINHTVAALTIQGFEILKVIVSTHCQPVIYLSKNGKCDELIKLGKACYQYSRSKYPIKQGVFYQDECRIVWPESLH